VYVSIQAAGGSWASNSINLLVKPGPLVFRMVDSSVVCIEGYTCQLHIATDRELTAEDLKYGSKWVALVLWWPGQPVTYDLVEISSQFTTYYFSYEDSLIGNSGFWTDLWTEGYAGSTYVSMIDNDKPYVCPIEPIPVTPTTVTPLKK